MVDHSWQHLVACINNNGKNDLDITYDGLEFLRCSDPEDEDINGIDEKY